MRQLVPVSIVLAVGIIAAAHAAPKPQVSISSKAAVVAVTVDEALRGHPGLAENCLAEGRRWAERMRAEADKEFRTDPTLFPEGRRWTYERGYELRSVVGRYVSVVREDGTYTGGAHPNTRIDTILWDRESKKRISIRPFFKETADNGPTMRAIARMARIAVAAEKIARGTINVDIPKEKLTPERFAALDEFIARGIAPSLLKLGPVTLAPSTAPGKSSGLTFHYSPYDVGAYAEGPYIAFVPWAALKSFLSAQGTAIFAGVRPERDKKR
ncbi:MAG: hypothetical protein ACRECO_07455 [Xanthobacteraceae bacterium]